MIEQRIHAALTASTALTSFAGARVYPLRLPQAGDYPALTYQRVSGTWQAGAQGRSRLGNARYQFDCWARRYAQVKALGAAVIAALGRPGHGFTAVVDAERDDFEPDTELYRLSIDVSIWYRD